jgi:hypothetical protein
MKNKILGIFVCLLFFTSAVPIVESLNKGTITTAPSSTSYALRKAFIFGRYTNLTAGDGHLTIEAVNLWVIYKEPTSFGHFPRGTQVTFEMYTAYGRMFKNIHVLFLHVELIV